MRNISTECSIFSSPIRRHLMQLRRWTLSRKRQPPRLSLGILALPFYDSLTTTFENVFEDPDRQGLHFPNIA